MSTGESGFSFERLEQEDGDVAIFTVHGRTQLNLVGIQTILQCADGISGQSTHSDIRCALIQGTTESNFIGGADLLELQALEIHNAAEFVGAIHLLCRAIREFPVPVLARISGHCLGAGLEIAAACDIRICDTSAVFGMPEVRVGVPSVVEAALLPQLIGWGKTRELVYRGNIINASEAVRIGLIEQLADEQELDDVIAEIITDILAGAPNAIRLQKELCRQWEALSLDAGIQAGLSSFAQAYETDEPQRYCEKFFQRKR
ncbi:MAG: enoyl-CoA hydratase [Gammaproteobacteria bacterium]